MEIAFITIIAYTIGYALGYVSGMPKKKRKVQSENK